VFVADGELGLVQGGRANGQTYDAETRARWHGMFVYIAEERGYQRGWIAHKYREKFGTFPDWSGTPWPIPPTTEVRSWVRSRQIFTPSHGRCRMADARTKAAPPFVPLDVSHGVAGSAQPRSVRGRSSCRSGARRRNWRNRDHLRWFRELQRTASSS
jgi:hypothetical protein